MLGTSDTWSTSHLSRRTSEPAYYIVDCRIFIQGESPWHNLISLTLNRILLCRRVRHAFSDMTELKFVAVTMYCKVF